MNTRSQVLGIKYVVGRTRGFTGFEISVTDLACGDRKSSHSNFSALRVPLHAPAGMMAKRDPTPTYAAGKPVLPGKLATLCVQQNQTCIMSGEQQ